ncbi:putative ATP-dependent endonuclease of OLD family [Rheinheimera pacifica]|uniref:ATP-dependent nuclease n=1 Tax=Rheinheimera pacifica TaxID=173990 RepID=UPI0028633834|nr:AAA family ATPase [Rheinheimera pacifica]MDR6981841.1 putative ATP-dependent endonuclease of OLD family [Rheinheimera pacifica]
MKICKVDISNFKTIKEITLDFSSDITLIVGKNNIGKSNNLKALEIFFSYLNFQPERVAENDIRKNSSVLSICVTFSKVKEIIKDEIKVLNEELSRKRPNRERAKESETLINCLETACSQKGEISLKLSIQRSNLKPEFDLQKKITQQKLNTYYDKVTKRHYAEKYFPEILKEHQKSNDNWINYNWISVDTDHTGHIRLSVDGQESINVKPDNVTEAKEDYILNRIKGHISLTQKFFYVPAYRGGKSEREQAINRLFDIIIEDLVSPRKGIAPPAYDTITDAIWGTGKNSNRYNIASVINDRVKKLVSDLKTDSISSIQGIEFKPFPREEIRKTILRAMLGTTELFIDDGISTTFDSKGTGIQSSFMITLMKALSKIEFQQNVNIILVIEEPEAFAHPQLIREIIHKIIQEIRTDLFQFVITTHSPVIVSYVDASKVQRLSYNSDKQETQNVTNLLKKKLSPQDWSSINRVSDVNLSEIVFSDLVIFVEGEGDKLVLDLMFKNILDDLSSKISVVSLSGCTQIFRLKTLLDYYNINWIMVLDKDAFVTRGFADKDLNSDTTLEEFFQNFQLGEEFKTHFRNVMAHPAVEKIKVSSNNGNTIKIGQVLTRIGDIVSLEGADLLAVRSKLFDLIKDRLGNNVFPENDAVEITSKLNAELQKHNIPFYCLTSDLEGLVINKGTKDIVNNIFEVDSEASFRDFKEINKNANEDQYLKSLRKSFGSKTYELEKKSSSGESRKKPHVPVEIVTKYLEINFKVENLKEKILSDFLDLKELEQLIVKKLK